MIFILFFISIPTFSYRHYHYHYSNLSHSLSHSLTPSLTQSHSLTHSITHSLSHSLHLYLTYHFSSTISIGIEQVSVVATVTGSHSYHRKVAGNNAPYQHTFLRHPINILHHHTIAKLQVATDLTKTPYQYTIS